MFATTLAASLALALPAAAQEAPKGAPSPNEIVAAAPAGDWVAIAPADLLVMTLAPPAQGPGQASRDGNTGRVVIQLMPPPFSQGWVGNIRKLAAAHWWDGLSINRVQDNYVVQWGDPEAEDKAKAKALPSSLNQVPEQCYRTDFSSDECAVTATGETVAAAAAAADAWANAQAAGDAAMDAEGDRLPSIDIVNTRTPTADEGWHERDSFAPWVEFHKGWPLGAEQRSDEWVFWPVHCYGMVGVGRGYSPDTGSGAELYTVIGHAPRHLDRNIALVGRVVEGIEHLSSLPRGTGPLGFYEKAEQRVQIVSIRLASGLPTAEQPRFQYLSTESDSFAQYADARANRRDPFFIVPAGGADICNIPVPVRRLSAAAP